MSRPRSSLLLRGIFLTGHSGRGNTFDACGIATNPGGGTKKLSVEADGDSLLRMPIRQGKRPPIAKNLEFVLLDESYDSLRLPKSEGSLLRDRFRNLQLLEKAWRA